MDVIRVNRLTIRKNIERFKQHREKIMASEQKKKQKEFDNGKYKVDKFGVVIKEISGIYEDYDL